MRLIDADALIAKPNNMNVPYRSDINEIICGMPIINDPRWIPFNWRETTEDDGYDPKEFPVIACGELPENGQEILVTNGVHVWDDVFFDDDGVYLEGGDDLFRDVIAWMPMPKPYDPEEEIEYEIPQRGRWMGTV